MKTKKYLLAAALVSGALIPNKSISKPIIIAIIDTGIDKNEPSLCKFGHKSFADKEPLVDRAGHGTHIAGIINRAIGANHSDYCLVSIKFWDPKASGNDNIDAMQKAIQYAVNINVDYINISAGGADAFGSEHQAILNALNQDITVVAAAGNESSDIDEKCNYFPACYDNRIVTVGNMQDLSTRAPSSNYGHYVKRWEIGTNILSDFPGGRHAYNTGTSQATAVATGKLVRSALGR